MLVIFSPIKINLRLKIILYIKINLRLKIIFYISKINDFYSDFEKKNK